MAVVVVDAIGIVVGEDDVVDEDVVDDDVVEVTVVVVVAITLLFTFNL